MNSVTMSAKLRSIIKLVLFIASVLLVAYIASRFFFRLDLTAEKRYTLTDVTRKTLQELETPVIVKVYLTGNDLPPGFRRLEKAVKEKLEDFIAYADQDIMYEFINPADFDDEGDRKKFYQKLRRKGLNPVELTERTKSNKTSRRVVFPGALFTYKGRQVAVNFLKSQSGQSPEQNLNSSVQALEYEFINAIHKLSTPEKKKVAIANGHGELPEENLQELGKVLSEYYKPLRVQIDSQTTNLEQYAAIIFAKPQKPFTEKEKFIIDQYLMQGGALMFLMDGVKVDMDSLRSRSFTVGVANNLNLRDMLFNYGLRVNNELLLDEECLPLGLARAGQGGQTRIQLYPWPYHPLIISKSEAHPVTRYLNPLRTSFVSTVDTVAARGVNKKILLATSPNSTAQAVPSRVSLDIISRQPSWDFREGPFAVAALAEGRFESVFANRLITRKFAHPDSIRQRSEKTAVIVAGDGDIVKNRVARSGEPYPMGFDRNARKNYKGNQEFVLNAVNYLCDDGGLMQVRMRELKLRLLDEEQIQKERAKWQIINTALPLAIVIILGVIINVLRRRRYAR